MGMAYQRTTQAPSPKDELRRFFRAIDESLRDHLGDETAPLVLASVQEYLPYYKEVNQYPHLVETQVVPGNPENTQLSDLHQKTWELVAPLFMEAQEDAVAQFGQLFLSGNDLSVKRLPRNHPSRRV